MTPFSLRYILIHPYHLRLGLPRSPFHVGLTVKILKAHIASSVLATRPANLSFLDLIPLSVLGE